jgi:hypothetical protein
VGKKLVKLTMDHKILRSNISSKVAVFVVQFGAGNGSSRESVFSFPFDGASY